MGVMGRNLALNIAEKGFLVSGYDPDRSALQAAGELIGESESTVLFSQLGDFLASLNLPRRILLMVPDNHVDRALELLGPHLQKGDILIDGGNSHYEDTERRFIDFSSREIYFLGMGVSGGEKGARLGPCLMPGGAPLAFQAVAPILNKIAAQIPELGSTCCGYMGSGGAGHFVKMVHNGIEYAVMQCIAEVYDIFSRAGGLPADRIAEIFKAWSDSELSSYLMEITGQVLAKIDPLTGRPLIEMIKDSAGQKGTGRWTAVTGIRLGVNVSLITAAVEARVMSSRKVEREALATHLKKTQENTEITMEEIQHLGDSLYFSVLTAYVQGMDLLRAGQDELGYDLNLGEITRIWQGGCIIRAKLLNKFYAIYREEPNRKDILMHESLLSGLTTRHSSLVQTLRISGAAGVPTPCLSAALAYYDGLTSPHLPANLIQAQRDNFGNHGFERINETGMFHSDWRLD